MQPASVFINHAQGGELLPAPHVVVDRQAVAAGLAAARILPELHRGLAVQTQAPDRGVGVGLVLVAEVGEVRIGLGEFFWGFALSTGRNR